jgi:hypothetical protein
MQCKLSLADIGAQHMKLECYVINDRPFEIEPAGRRRDWMDQTEGLAYRCLPLTMANSHGWVIRCVESFEAVWRGGANKEAVEIVPLEPDQKLSSVDAHFGSGILTFNGRAIFRTSPGYNLWIMGPPNSFKDAIQPLSALVESDWMPYTFTMNWKFTRPDTSIRFEKGEPYALIFPVRRGDVEAVEPELKKLKEDPELAAQARDAVSSRKLGHFVADELKVGHNSQFQGWYMRGEIPFRRGTFDEHQRHLEVRPFKPIAREADTNKPSADGE